MTTEQLAALNEIEVALISIADGVSPHNAVQKAFEIINRERLAANTAPRATGETTVEACLAELREMFPDLTSEISQTTSGTVEIAVWGNDVIPRRKIYKGAATVADCMALVRAVTRTEGEGS